VTTDWRRWHRDYDDPSSLLSRRLVVVRKRVGESLDALGPDARRALGLCAGEGRDLLPELAARPGLGLEAVLVEVDPVLAEAARAAASAAGLERVVVRTTDAGLSASFVDALPADLLLLCGIFGNVSERDIHRTISVVPQMLQPGGLVIWTRGCRDDHDLRLTVRRWFVEEGFEEIAYDGEPEPFGVGVARWPGPARAGGGLPERLFTFIR